MALGLLRFTNALAGTADFIYPGPAIDMQSPASAGAVNGTTYLYYAQSLDMTQWEIGSGAYASAGGTFARTTITANSLGTAAKINFTNPPQVIVFDTFPAADLSAYAPLASPALTGNPTAPTATPGDNDTSIATTAFVTAALAVHESAWAAFTPTITATAGTFTTVSATGRYKQIGKTVFVSMAITITTVGTASGGVNASLPAAAQASGNYILTGRGNALSGNLLQAKVSGSTATIFNYNNSSVIAAGEVLLISGVYEAA